MATRFLNTRRSPKLDFQFLKKLNYQKSKFFSNIKPRSRFNRVVVIWATTTAAKDPLVARDTSRIVSCRTTLTRFPAFLEFHNFAQTWGILWFLAVLKIELVWAHFYEVIFSCCNWRVKLICRFANYQSRMKFLLHTWFLRQFYNWI